MTGGFPHKCSVIQNFNIVFFISLNKQFNCHKSWTLINNVNETVDFAYNIISYINSKPLPEPVLT